MKSSDLFRNKNFRNLLIFAASLLCGYIAYTLPLNGLGEAGRISLGIFVIAVLLWVTEAVPIFITSSVILALEVIFLGRPGGPLHLEGSGYEVFINAFSSPVVLLLLGGFALALAIQKHGLGNMLAVAIIKRAGNRPEKVLLGAMITTGFLSMWISNTAATASMIVVILPVLKFLDSRDPFRKALLLGIPFSSSIGGMGTPIGTPPNAIAIGLLQKMGVEITFFKWMVLVIPAAALIMYAAWRVLIKLFPCKVSAVEFEIAADKTLNFRQKLILAFAITTVFFWLTGPIHHIPAAIISLFPLVAFFGFGFLEKTDFSELGWNVLIVVGGGIALGVGMEKSGLTNWLADRLNLEGLPLILGFLLFGLLTMAMSTFISNSAVANLFLPIALGFAMFKPGSIGLCVALSASLAMALPISTPPNAIAYGSGELEMKDMIKAGSIIAGIGVLIIGLYVFVLSKLFF